MSTTDTILHRDIRKWVLRESTDDVVGCLTPGSYVPSQVVLHRASCSTLRVRRTGLPSPVHPRWPWPRST